MTFQFTKKFTKDFKKLLKKYKKLDSDFDLFLNDFNNNHKLATSIKNNIYKARIKNSEKAKGKSSGYRVYYYVKLEDTAYFLTIYDKSEIEMIDETILKDVLDSIE